MRGLAADNLFQISLSCTLLLLPHLSPPLSFSQKRKKNSKTGSGAGSGGRSASSFVSTTSAAVLVVRRTAYTSQRAPRLAAIHLCCSPPRCTLGVVVRGVRRLSLPALPAALCPPPRPSCGGQDGGGGGLRGPRALRAAGGRARAALAARRGRAGPAAEAVPAAARPRRDGAAAEGGEYPGGRGRARAGRGKAGAPLLPVPFRASPSRPSGRLRRLPGLCGREPSLSARPEGRGQLGGEGSRAWCSQVSSEHVFHRNFSPESGRARGSPSSGPGMRARLLERLALSPCFCLSRENKVCPL